MPSRRRVLALLGAAGLAGCTGTPDGSETPSPTGTPTLTGSPTTPTDEPPETTDQTPFDLPDWESSWSLAFDGTPLGLTSDAPADDGQPTDGTWTSDSDRLYVTSQTDGKTTIAAVDTAGRAVEWRRTLAGTPVSYSYANSQGLARGGWGVTVTSDAVYAVAGEPTDREPTAIHALDPASGERLWRLRRDRRLGVVGVTDDLLVATGREYAGGSGTPPPTHATDTEPAASLLYGIDPTSGAVRWTQELLGHRETVVTSDGVYAASDAGLRVFAPDGTPRTTDDATPASAVAPLGDGIAYLAGDDSPTLYGLDATGTRRWSRSLPADELLADGDRLYAGGDVVASVTPDGSLAWRDENYGQWLLLTPDRARLYTRSGRAADAVTAYTSDGTRLWQFDPPSNNAWPEAATREAVAVSAITGDTASEPFLTTYAVGPDGRPRKSRGFDSLFDALGADETIYVVADGDFLALDP